MNGIEQSWFSALAERKVAGNYRSLSCAVTGIDFRSNDYLGFAKDNVFLSRLACVIQSNSACLAGATGSRLISGNSEMAGTVETFIAQQHGTGSALLFPSGYKANLALFSCIARRNDTIIVDELIHRSVHDACMLSKATKWKFRHNDLGHLENLLKKSKARTFIAVESLYSMDGNFAPLIEIVALAKRYEAFVIVDEAHATGVFGLGLVHEYGLNDGFIASVVTYGKALGVSGAAILGPQLLKEYLVNFASPFIYSTAMPDVQLLQIREAYLHLSNNKLAGTVLQQNIRRFRAHQVHSISADKSPVQVVRFKSPANLKEACGRLAAEGLLVYAVFSPTVQKGSERLRICLHEFNSSEEIDLLGNTISLYL